MSLWTFYSGNLAVQNNEPFREQLANSCRYIADNFRKVYAKLCSAIGWILKFFQNLERVKKFSGIYFTKVNFSNNASYTISCTKFNGETSDFLSILASIIQGSAIGPASYFVTASDLHPVTPGNSMHKYADDTYLVVPGANSH